MDEKYDIAIIGTGPAGLEAAITAKLRNKNILLFGSKTSSKKVYKATEFQNYLGFPNISGKELNKKFLEHIEKMGIKITEEKVNNVFSLGDYFNIQVDNKFYKSKTVILATGINFGKPYIGEEKFLGKGVSYCATCDGLLYKEKIVAVIAMNEKEENEANYLSEIAKKVYYFPMYKDIKKLNNNIEVINEIPKEIQGDLKVRKIITDKNAYDVDGIFILRDAISPKNLVPGLKTNKEEVEVNKKMETNIKGLFAAGDIVGRPYQCIKAAGEGNIAALSAVEYIDNL